MATAILMPSLSPTMTEGNLAKWCKNVGDEIKSGDIIAEVETDKATMEIEAVDEGILDKVLFNDGEEGISVNALIAVLRNKNDSDKDVEEVLNKHKTGNDKKRTSKIEKTNDKVLDNSTEISGLKDNSEDKNKEHNENIIINNDNISLQSLEEDFVEKNTLDSSYIDKGRIAISPLAKRIAIQNKVNLKSITGTGPRGRIIKKDITNFISNNNNLINYSS